MERGTRNVQWDVMCPRCVTGQKLSVEELFPGQRHSGDRWDVPVKFPSIEEKLRQREDSALR